MRLALTCRTPWPVLTAGLFFCVSAWSQTNSCDLNGDGKVDKADVDAIINMSLGAPCTANIAGANVCNVVVVQRVINASMGGACVTSTGLHSVSLTWTASVTPGVTGYKVYRATASGGPYTLVSTTGAVATYMDNTVQSGATYYYVITAVGSGESAYSTQAQAVVPIP